MTEMTALRAHRRGGPEVLVVERAPVPAPAAGEVLVSVHAAAITFDELTWDETWARDGVSRTPVVLSHEVSGVVSEIGSGVTDFRPGDGVYGLIDFDRDGAAAEFVAVPATDLAAKPSTVSHTLSAALPLAGLTAWQALVDKAGLRPGQKVLIHAGSGGLGTIAIQLAKHLGATVATTTSTKNLEWVKALGADVVIDYRTTDFTEVLHDYNVVLDTQGGPTLEKSDSRLSNDILQNGYLRRANEA